MNKIFKVIFNHATQTWVAVSELAKGHTKSSVSATKPNDVTGGSFVLTALAFGLGLGLAGQGYAAVETVSSRAPHITTGAAPNYNNLIGVESSTSGTGNVVVGAFAANGRIITETNGRVNRPVEIGEISQGTAVGFKAKALASQSTALGADVVTVGYGSVALGGDDFQDTESKTKINEKFATEYNNSAGVYNVGNGTALGSLAKKYGTAFNTNEYANTASVGTASTALGVSSQSLGTGSLAMGLNAVGFSAGSVAVGAFARAGQGAGKNIDGFNGDHAIAVGTGANASQSETIAVGHNATASAANTIVAGQNATAVGQGAIVVGQDANSNAINSVVIGNQANVARGQFSNSVAIGFNATSSGTEGTAVGNNATVTHPYGTVLGSDSRAANYGTAVGYKANTNNEYSVAVGNNASTNHKNASAFGSNATVTGELAVALGSGANASVTNSVALGAGSTTTAANIDNDAKLWVGKNDAGKDANANFAGVPSKATSVVSVGSAGKERQIQNVAAGKISADSTDAVNGSQLYQVAKNVGFNIAENTANKSRINTDGNVAFSDGSYTTANVTDGNNAATVKFDVVTQDVTVTNGVASAATGTAGLTTAATVADAINKVADASGFRLKANSTDTGEKINANNTGVVTITEGTNINVSRNGSTITVKTNDNVNFTNVNATGTVKAATVNATTGNIQTVNATTVNATTGNIQTVNATTVNATTGNIQTVNATNVNSTSVNAKNGNFSENLNSTGNTTIGGSGKNFNVTAGTNVDFGGNKIQGVAEGTANTDAVNKGQLDKALANATTNISYSGNTGSANHTLKDRTIAITGSKNISTKVSDGKIEIEMSETPSFTNITTTAGATIGGDLNVTGASNLQAVNATNISANNITAKEKISTKDLTANGDTTLANTTIGGEGQTFNIAGKTAVNFGNNKIQGVATGEGDTDAVNVKQLNEVVNAAKASSHFKIKANSEGSATDIKTDGTGVIDFVQDKNIVISRSGEKITVKTAENVKFTNVDATKVNATTVNATQVEATNGTFSNGLTATGDTTLGNTTIGGKDKTFTILKDTKTDFGGNTLNNITSGAIENGNTSAVTGGAVHNAIENISNTLTDKGLKFAANEGTAVTRKLGETLTIKGDATTAGNYSSANIKTVVNNDTVEIKFAEDPTFNNVTAKGNVTVEKDLTVNGNTTVKDITGENASFKNVNATKVNATDVNATNVNATNGTFTNVTASNGTITNLTSTNINTTNLTATGDTTLANTTIGGTGKNFTVANGTTVNLGNNRIQNVGDAVEKTDAVNKGQLDTAINTLDKKGLTFSADTGTDTKRELGQTLKIAGGNGNGNYATTNVKTEVEEGVVTIKIAEDPTFNNITAKGNVTVEKDLKVDGNTTVKDITGDNATFKNVNATESVTTKDLNVTNNATISKDLTVNGNTTVKDITGENATFKNVNATENITTKNLTATGDTTLGNTTIGGKDKTFTILKDTKTDFGGNTLNNITSGAIENGNTSAVTGGAVHNAIENISNTLTDKGLKFAANEGTAVTRKLGETLTIKGDATTAGNYSSANIKTVVNNDTVEIKFAEDPTFNNVTAKGNVTVEKDLTVNGNTTVKDITGENASFKNVNATKVNATDVNATNVNATNGTFTNVTASNGTITNLTSTNINTTNLTATGDTTLANTTIGGTGKNFTVANGTTVNLGNNRIQNVGDAVEKTDAVNKGQLDTAINTLDKKGLTFSADTGTDTKRELGQTLKIAGGNGNGNYATTNVKTEVEEGVVTIKIAEDPTFNNITAKGNVTVEKDLKVDGNTTVKDITGDNATFKNVNATESVTTKDLNVTNNATISKDLTVNGNTTVKDITGENATFKNVNATENITTKNLTATGDTTLGNTTIGGKDKTFTILKDTKTDFGGNTLNNITSGAIENGNTSAVTGGAVHNAIENISNTLTDKGLKFAANEGTAVTRKLGETLTIKGDATTAGNYSSANIKTVVNNDTVEIKFAEDPTFNNVTAKGNVTVEKDLTVNGNTTVKDITGENASFKNVNATKVNATDVNATNVNATNGTFTNVTASNGTITNLTSTNINTTNLTATGDTTLANTTIGGTGKNFTVANGTTVNLGNNRIQNVGDAVEKTDAVNKGQLDTAINTLDKKGLTFSADTGTDTKRELGQTLKIAGGNGNGNYATTNVKTEVEEGVVTIKIAEDPTFNNITAKGNVTVEKDLKVDGNTTVKDITGDNATFKNVNATESVTTKDLNVTNNATISKDLTVNGNTTVKDITGENATFKNVNATENITTKNLTATGDTTLGNTTIGGKDKTFTILKDTKTDFGGNTLNNITSGAIENGNTSAVTGGAVHNAIENISNTLTDKGLKFAANEGTAVTRKLGETLTIKGDATTAGNYSSANIKTVVNNDTVEIKFAEDPTFNNVTAKGNVTVEKDLTVNGNTTVKDITGENASFKNVNATKVNATDVNATNVNATNGTFTNVTASNGTITNLTSTNINTTNLTATGDTTLANTTIGGTGKNFTVANGTTVNLGNNRIQNVGDAVEKTDAVNKGQLDTAINTLDKKGLTFSADTGTDTKRELGQTLKIAGGNGNGNYATTNVKTEVEEGVVTIKIAEDPTFNNITAKGNVTVEKDLKVDGNTTVKDITGDNATFKNVNATESVTTKDLNVTNNATISKDLTVNGNTTVKDITGENATFKNVNATENITTKNLTATGDTTLGNTTIGGKDKTFTILKDTKTDFGGNTLNNITSGAIENGNTSAVTGGAVHNAIENISNTLTDKGLKFAANEGTAVTRKLGETLTIKGDATTAGNYSSANIKTVVNNDTVEIKFAEDPTFNNVTAKGNVTVEKDLTVNGNTTVKDITGENASFKNVNATKVNATDVNATNVNATNGTFTNVTASNGTITNLTSTNINTTNLTATGDTTLANTTIGGTGKNFTVANGTTVNLGNNRIQNVGDAVEKTDAVNKGQLDTAINTLDKKGLTFSADTGTDTKRELGQTLKIAGGNGNGNYATTNVKTEVEEGVVTIKIAEDPTFNNITAKGNVTVEKDLKVDGNTTVKDITGDNATFKNVNATESVTTKDLNVTNNATISKDLTVNGNTTVKDITGENATFKNVNATENITTKNLTATGDTTLGNTTIGGKDKTFTILKDTKTDFGGNTLNNITSGAIENGNTSAVTGGAVHNAIENISNTLTDKGLKFAANEGTAVTRKLGETLTIKGDATTAGNYSSANIKTVVNNDTVEIKFAEDPTFNNVTAKGNVTVEKDLTVNGTTTTKDLSVNNNATIAKDLTVKGTTTTNNLTATGDTVLGNTTIGGKDKTFTIANGTTTDFGGNTLNNITSGAIENGNTSAVTGGTVHNAIENVTKTLTDKGLSFATNDDGKIDKKLGETLTIKGDATTAGKYSSANIKTVANNGVVEVQIAENPEFNDVKAKGNVSVDKNLSVSGDTTLGNTTIGGEGNHLMVERGTAVNMGGNTIHNIGEGYAPTDAVNKAQLDRVSENLDRTDRKLRAGIASASAAANIPQVTLPGKSLIGAGVANFSGESAVSIGYSGMTDNGRVIIKFNAGATTRGDHNIGGGIGYQW
ncbi:ESPR-type extended signal peptide-containing protein [Moraxella sp. ZJ142]|uniref:ESPR-type extended signal peptide-containing protein n=1 Tax=Moraxella marmotae TaxID=3344520 RepID=UPI0035D4CB09